MDDDLGDEVSGFRDGVSRFYRDGILVEAGSETDPGALPTRVPEGLSQAERELFRELVQQERAVSDTRRRAS
jgi:hypothetical protein